MEMEKVRNRVQIQYCVASFLTETMSLHQCRQMAARSERKISYFLPTKLSLSLSFPFQSIECINRALLYLSENGQILSYAVWLRISLHSTLASKKLTRDDEMYFPRESLVKELNHLFMVNEISRFLHGKWNRVSTLCTLPLMWTSDGLFHRQVARAGTLHRRLGEHVSPSEGNDGIQADPGAGGRWFDLPTRH